MVSFISPRSCPTAGFWLVAFALLLVFASASRDFYKILGVDRQASIADIKKAYRTLSKLHHPDKNPGDDAATAKFAELSEAYGVLSDEESRSTYDRFGEDGLKNGGGGGGFHGGDPFDIFAQFFGGGGGHGHQKQETHGPSFALPLDVTLAELFVGHTMEMEISRQVLCDHCHGSGAEDPDDVTTCTTCQGRGVRVMQQMIAPGFVQSVHTTCDACSGTGQVVKTQCKTCQGHKVQRSNEMLTIPVVPGMPDGHRIPFERMADQSPDWDVPGSVVFIVRTAPHPTLTREGSDLHLKYTISLLQALVGFDESFTHLDGKTVVPLRRSAVTPPGHVQKIVGQGMPHYDSESDTAKGTGDLYVHYTVDFPKSVAAKDQIALRSILSVKTAPSQATQHDEL
ncbi:DnaJ- protein scj1 [Tieghemiomyces parasiticus]|uniref:DnaJ- protein scj1 n=1 Tax=Tieghemiomyces parasiticus TaxID=78921 RepID=A0A9W8A545_9FUNG|nr:DnaJ- protein scj1 [Tieghemiomyces parasiticus]